MKKLIKIGKEFFLLSDETENTGGKLIMWTGETVEHFPKQATPKMGKYSISINTIYAGKPAGGYKLIIASTRDFSIDNHSMSYIDKLDRILIESMLQLNPDVEGLANAEWDENHPTERSAYKQGFNKHAELNADKKFTLQDVKASIDMAVSLWVNRVNCTLMSEIEAKVIQSISVEKSEWNAEIEMYPSPITTGNELGEEGKDWELKPKITDGYIKITKIN